ncbi:hypothetical protein [Halobacterium sp. CBA1126]|uniref:hypothetical protein n=1 Tax=Halobacterium sp. CBA1126 TaxID=2668074 RepID=UPI0012F91E86|nr:hypothetical protein [Halobacterium sp. CBA1126]MUV59964.1 hypothetical protein [Halobacterium sp. CBA1126]
MTNDDQLQLHVGDHVVDKEDDDATLLVATITPKTASEYDVGDQTVAAYNEDYPRDDDVIEVRYPQRTTQDIDRLDDYAFPRSRLELVEPLHDRDDEEVDASE